MVSLTVDREEFINYLTIWAKSGRGLVTLMRITENSLELHLSIISIDNTKHVTLDRTFYTYRSIMGYYGNLIDIITEDL